MSALCLDGVAYAYEDIAMRFDLDVEAGEWLAVIGPSGAGKSTLLDLVAGFITPHSGRILIEGRDVTQLHPSQRPVSFVFQENNLFPHLDAFANVALGISPKLRLSAGERRDVSGALAAVGLAGMERRRPAELSGGERQRVALARAFLRQRPLLLLDEPFAALGPALRVEMLDLLAGLKDERRDGALTILMVTHQPQDASAHAGRIAFVEDGRIAALGPTIDMLAGTGSSPLRAYLGESTMASWNRNSDQIAN